MAHPFATMVLDDAPLAVRPGLLMEDPVHVAIAKISFILCIIIKNFKDLTTKIRVSPPNI